MTNRNNTWNATEAWTNTPFNAWTNNGANPFGAWNVAPFTAAPFNTAITAFASATPNTPAANAYENSESYTFEIAAPGYTTDSFELSYAYPTLTLRATAPKSDRPASYSYREFNYGSFTREFTMPNNADANEARAKYENGILTVMVPKTAATNHRTIKIS
jgi:HSP20 family protein